MAKNPSPRTKTKNGQFVSDEFWPRSLNAALSPISFDGLISKFDTDMRDLTLTTYPNQIELDTTNIAMSPINDIRGYKGCSHKQWKGIINAFTEANDQLTVFVVHWQRVISVYFYVEPLTQRNEFSHSDWLKFNICILYAMVFSYEHNKSVCRCSRAWLFLVGLFS